MKDYSKAVEKEAIKKTITSLQANGMVAHSVRDYAEAKAKVLELIPEGEEVFASTSVTLDESGISEAIDGSGKYESVRNALNGLDREKDADKMRKLGAAPNYMIGSVHALTQDGHLLVASNTGSQLPGYSYGAGKVVFVIGAQKIVEDLAEASERVEKYVLPLESERAKKAYGAPGSEIKKELIIKKELTPERIHVVIVEEPIGY